MRVLQWIVERIENRADGQEQALGVSPRYEDLNWSGLDFSPAQFESVISVDANAWREELASHDELFARLQQGLPAQLPDTREAFARRLANA